MDIFTLLLGLVVVAAAAFMVGAPLMKSATKSYDMRDVEVDMEQGLDKRKEDTFAILNEIEFDYKTDKLSEEDYKFLKNKYQKQAVEILKSEEEMVGTKLTGKDLKDLEQQVEDEIAKELEKMLANKEDK